MNALERLVQLADELDRKGLLKEATFVDSLIKKAADVEKEEALTEIENHMYGLTQKYGLDVPPKNQEWSEKVYAWMQKNAPKELAEHNFHKEVVDKALKAIYGEGSGQ